MSADIKAIVFKTSQLKATREFFENMLTFKIKESSARHFVVYSKSIRLVFVESLNDFEVEMYVYEKSNLFSKEIPGFKTYKDPNGISIIIT